MKRAQRPGRPLPKLRRKANGAYFVRIFRRDYSLGSDRVEAESRRAALIAEHYGPAHDAAGRREEPAGVPPDHDEGGGALSPISARSPLRAALVAELVQPFLESLRLELDEPAAAGVAGLPASVNRPAPIVAYYAKHLKRFVALHGRKGVARLAMPVPGQQVFQAPVVTLMYALRDDMRTAKRPGGKVGYSARTIRHDLRAVAQLFKWAASRGYCPSVVFTEATKVRTPTPAPRPAPRAWIKADVERALADPSDLVARIIGHAAALSYLACLRPTELVRLAHIIQLPPHASHQSGLDELDAGGGGVFGALVPVPSAMGAESSGGPGVFQIVGKTTHVTDEMRILPLSDEAIEHMEGLRHATLLWRRSRPRSPLFPWSRLDAWSAAYRAWTRGHAPKGWPPPLPDPKTKRSRPACVSPSTLRDSAATHLDEAGVPRADRDLLLGHVGHGSWRSYDRIAWQRLRALAARLTLR